MALSVTINQHEVVGRQRYRAGTIDFDSSYPTGGEALSAATLDLSSVALCLVAPSAGLYFEYDHTNHKVIARYPTGGASAPATLVAPVAAAPTATAASATSSAPVATLANAVIPAGATPVTSTGAQPALTMTQPTISAPTITVVQPTISAPALTAGVGLEVGNTTDLSTVTGVRFVVWGR